MSQHIEAALHLVIVGNSYIQDLVVYKSSLTIELHQLVFVPSTIQAISMEQTEEVGVTEWVRKQDFRPGDRSLWVT